MYMSVLCLRGGCIFCVTFPALAFSYLFEAARTPFIFLVIEASEVEGIPADAYNMLICMNNNNTQFIF